MDWQERASKVWTWVSHIDTVLGWAGRVVWVVAIVISVAGVAYVNAYWLAPLTISLLMIGTAVVAGRRSPPVASSQATLEPKHTTSRVRSIGPYRSTLSPNHQGPCHQLCTCLIKGEELRTCLIKGEELLQGIPALSGYIAHAASGRPITSEFDVENWETGVEQLLQSEPRLLAIFASWIDHPGGARHAARFQSDLFKRLDRRMQMLEKIINQCT